MQRIIILLFVSLISMNLLHAEIKIGIIGLDTSHAPAFTKLINAENKQDQYKGFRIVAAYPYGSQTIQSSYERIPKYIEDVKSYGVEIVESIAELLEKVDCVMLETNDGNLHLEQAAEVFKAGKIVFIDKPIGADLVQSIAIFELAKQYKVPMFSSSALRFTPQNQKLAKGEFGEIIGVDCSSPSPGEPSHADFSWYGMHGVETLFTAMGTGCVSVSRMSSEGTDVVTGLWEDGRIGTFRGIRQGKGVYGGRAYTAKGVVDVGGYEGFGHMLDHMMVFFKTGIAPVSEQETLEIFTFMEASNISKSKNGRIISMEKTYKDAAKKAKKLLKRKQL